MEPQYMLLDVKTGNSQGAFATEAEALRAVADDVARNGRASAEDLALVAPKRRESLSGPKLVDRALQRFPLRRSASLSLRMPAQRASSKSSSPR